MNSVHRDSADGLRGLPKEKGNLAVEDRPEGWVHNLAMLVGRNGELEELEHALYAARQGCGRVVFLVGEDGIGKSRLALEIADRAFSGGMCVLRGRGSSIGPMVSFRPLTEALLPLFRPGGVLADNELGPYQNILRRLIPECGHGQPAEGVDSLVVLAEAILRLISAAGRGRGCLIILEDLQNADTETLAVLEFLADNLRAQSTTLLATARADPGGTAELFRAVARRGSGLLIELDRLDRSELRQLAASRLEVKPDDMPDGAVDRLWQDSAGNPFIAAELLDGMISDGLLLRNVDGQWRIGGIRSKVPHTLVRSFAERAARLGPQGRMLLSVAAVIGRRFPISVVQAVLGVTDRDLHAHLRAGVVANLVSPDEPTSDWYTFAHPLIAEALLSQLTPADRASIARRAAGAVALLHPGLPGEWCQSAAALWLDTGDRIAAAQLFAIAGSRALAAGPVSSAVAMLNRAWELLIPTDEVNLRADVLEVLLLARAEAGQVDSGGQLTGVLDELCDAGLDSSRLAALHTQLAWVTTVAGRWDDGITQLDAARTLLGKTAVDQYPASIDSTAAYLAWQTSGEGGPQSAEELARRAAARAEQTSRPVLACQAWQLLGILARRRSVEEATTYFERVEALAREHRMPVRRTHARLHLGVNDWLTKGDITRLEQAGHQALRLGMTTLSYDVTTVLALHQVLRGQFSAAAQLIEQCSAEVNRLRLAETARHLLLVRATLAAHQANRREMDRSLAEFRRAGGERSPLWPLTLGLATVFCALLEEDREQARSVLAQTLVLETRNAVLYPLVGGHGLHLLLEVLSGNAGWPQYHEVSAAPASGLRWNWQFVLLAHAVLLGRSGHRDEAMAVMTQAEQVAAPYVMAKHLGLRLVAEAAHADRWGDPVTWLHRAEEYFHNASVPAVAGASRALLRRIGAVVPQRRKGVDRVPRSLRMLGVTVREYEVLHLLVDRLTNQAIANRLYISPRTVEKHIASLITKTNQPNRAELNAYAARETARESLTYLGVSA